MSSPDRTLSPAQLARLTRYNATRCVDMHCHCLPGVDDGPVTGEEALALCKLLVEDGFTDVIATPHQLGRYDGVNWADEIRRVVADLQSALDQAHIPLVIHPGAEVRIDERIPKLLAEDRLLTLADGGAHLLLELPASMAVSAEAVDTLIAAEPDVQVVLAHAERYDTLRRDPLSVQAWVEREILMQVNASSLLPDAPPESRQAAMLWIARGWVSLIGSDAHNANSRRPRMTEAIELIEQEFGHEIARVMCVENPALLVIEEDDAPAGPATPFDMI